MPTDSPTPRLRLVTHKRRRHASYRPRDVDQRRYVRLPDEVLYDRSLSDGAVRLYGVLIRWATWRSSSPRGAGVVHGLAVGQLAADVGKSHAQARRYLSELRDAGHVTIDQAPIRGGKLTIRLLWISLHPVAVERPERAHG